MSDDNNNKFFIGIFGLVMIMLFLIFCNLYQPNAEIATLTLTTIYMSLLWVCIIQILIVLFFVVLLAILGATS